MRPGPWLLQELLQIWFLLIVLLVACRMQCTQQIKWGLLHKMHMNLVWEGANHATCQANIGIADDTVWPMQLHFRSNQTPRPTVSQGFLYQCDISICAAASITEDCICKHNLGNCLHQACPNTHMMCSGHIVCTSCRAHTLSAMDGLPATGCETGSELHSHLGSSYKQKQLYSIVGLVYPSQVC